MQVVFEIKPDGEILRFNSLVFEFLFQIYHNYSRVIEDENEKKSSKTFSCIQNIVDYLDANYTRQIWLHAGTVPEEFVGTKRLLLK